MPISRKTSGVNAVELEKSGVNGVETEKQRL